MPEPDVAAASKDEPLIVYAHATPWGFLVALPLALVLAYLGASQIDADEALHPLASLGGHSISLLGVLLVGFSLYLFLVGIGELAGYLKPAVEAVLDDEGIAIYSLVGQQRMAWRDVADTHLQADEFVLYGRMPNRSGQRSMRLHLSRLAIDPNALFLLLRKHRPDLALKTGLE